MSVGIHSPAAQRIECIEAAFKQALSTKRDCNRRDARPRDDPKKTQGNMDLIPQQAHRPETPESGFDESRTGTLLITAGAIGIVLLLLAGLECLPFRWEQLIRSNAPIWCLGSGALLVAGISRHWRVGHETHGWAPSRPGRRFENIIVYTRESCPLCDEGIELLGRYRRWLPPADEVNVDDDPRLLTQHGEWVPVVFIDGRPRFRGHINEVLLRRLIEGTPPHPKLRQR